MLVGPIFLSALTQLLSEVWELRKNIPRPYKFSFLRHIPIITEFQGARWGVIGVHLRFAEDHVDIESSVADVFFRREPKHFTPGELEIVKQSMMMKLVSTLSTPRFVVFIATTAS